MNHGMTFRSWRIPLLAGALAAAVALAACESDARRAVPVTADVQTRMTAGMHPALRGTIGEFAALVDAAPIRVEGWGIVGGLPNTGSGDMDPRVRELLLNRLLTIGVGMYSTGTQNINPEDILASQQIAVVEVRGIIPPLARKGSTFDLYINAIPGSGTTSLANGLLWPGDLKQIGLTFEGNDTRTIATGRGPVFIPGPLEAVASQAAGGKPVETARALRSGRVIAGGVCAEDREARLQLYSSDWMRTRMIERAINAHFPGRDKAATADNESIIQLHIPAEFRDNPMDFVDQVRHLYLATDAPGFIETRARTILEALQEPGAPHRDLGLALQGLGRSILPEFIQPNYTSANQELRFWCARAGACLQDVQGLATLQEIVRDPGNPFRRQALIAMIEASRGRDTERATQALYDMIRSYNTDDRILAYHALLAIRSHAVSTYNVGLKFMMDVIPADSPPLIYVLEAESPRIAFIGRDITLPPGATFISNDKLLSVIVDDPADGPPPIVAAAVPVRTGLFPATAPGKNKEKETVTLYWRSPLGDKTALLRTVPSLPGMVARACWIPDPLSADFDPKAQYVGATYQRITELLAGMCADKTIDAAFVVEHSPEALINPTDLALSGRPEGSTKVQTPASAPAPEAPKPPSDTPGAPQIGAPNPGTPGANLPAAGNTPK